MTWVIIGAGALVMLLFFGNQVAAGVISFAPWEGSSVDGSQVPPNVLAIAQAIAQAEGFYVSGALPQRQNNPGDLSNASGIMTFSDMAAGWRALYGQINLMISGGSHVYSPTDTITQISQKWTTDVPPGAQANWAANVARSLGLTPDNTFLDVGSNISQVIT